MAIPTNRISLPQLTAGVAVASASAGYLYLRSMTSFLGEDLKTLVRFGKSKRMLGSLTGRENYGIGDYLEEAVDKFSDIEFLRYIDPACPVQSYTFKQVDERVNQFAHHFYHEIGVRKGNVVALMMDNRPEFLFVLYGLAKIGATVSLINTNLCGAPLKHSLKVCKATYMVIGDEHIAAVQEMREDDDALKSPLIIWMSEGPGSHAAFYALRPRVSECPTERPPASWRTGCCMNDIAVYIYTSGTTGNPKPSLIKGIRLIGPGILWSNLTGIGPDDKLYGPLPLYHSAAMFLGVGSALASGCAFVFRRKFSATQYFSDCGEHGCTIGQYIGELCRYLLNTPESVADTKHRIRTLVGNGLRPDIWRKFQERFRIANIFEFYGATEGNVGFINTLGKEGACGYLSNLFKKFIPVEIVQFDVEKELPVRNKDGFCVKVAPGETGELISLIQPGDPLREFIGYADKKATEKKILHDVFKKGDMYFRTGDLLRRDEEGFLYFVDRIGDTFRWQGENVSTNEVAEVVSTCRGILEANVYGVQIPNKDGRAGMAAIVVKEGFSMDELAQVVQKNLPKYARPVFIRILPAMDITGTFKHKKVALVQEGYDPSKLQDPLFVLDRQTGKYVPLTPAAFAELGHQNFARL